MRIGTVEGYVVGHTISSGHYRFSGNFANDYNVAIADKKEETSPENILPVHLPFFASCQIYLMIIKAI